MRIGVQPANSGPLATPEFISEIAELADGLGFDSLQITDHLVMPVEYSSRYPYNASGRMAAGPDDTYFEPLGLIAYLGGRTRRIRLGTSVLIAPYRHPVVTAKYLAGLDQLTGGRLLLGVGVGWMAEEFAALGAPSFAERGAVTDEIIQVWRTLWRDQPASFAGRFFQFAPLGLMPKPAQPGGIPIYIGGSSRPAIRRAARLGDGWQPFKLSPDELAPGLALLRDQSAKLGRSLDGFTISMRLGLRLSAVASERRSSEEPWKALVGTPAEVIRDLEAYERLGVNEAVFDFRSCSADETRETLRLAAAELLPRFQQQAAAAKPA
ncbi:MAG TPA: LLM class F420-dependent oxidoreductase [Dehalococcoidia bacterium]|nr:LLM class F420-dependent oxidoreductase [Dehalococcoidia bacterium]